MRYKNTRLLLENLVAESAERLRLLPNVVQVAITANWEDGLREPCILWPGGRVGNRNPDKRYGAIYLENGKQILAHRYVYLFAFGKIPHGLYVCHRCDIPHCIQPFHVFAGTQKENIHDMFRKSRANRVGHKGIKGSAHPWSVFSEDQVLQIRELFSQGARICDIHRQFGHTRSNISHIIARKTWTHI